MNTLDMQAKDFKQSEELTVGPCQSKCQEPMTKDVKRRSWPSAGPTAGTRRRYSFQAPMSIPFTKPCATGVWRSNFLDNSGFACCACLRPCLFAIALLFSLFSSHWLNKELRNNLKNR